MTRGRVGAAVRAGGTVIGLYLLLQVFWPTPAGVVVQGVIVGSLTGLISFGIALTYRSNRVVNFAAADLGAVPATLGVTLLTMTQREGSRLVDKGWPYGLAMAVAVGAAVGLGWLVERVVIRHFARAPRLILMVVTIGLSQVLLGVASVIPTTLSDSVQSGATLFDPPVDFRLEVSPIVFGGNDAIALAVAALCFAGLFAFLRFTLVGTAMRASAESADRASLLGVNVGATQNVAWIIATVLSSIALLMRAGILGLPLGSAFGPTILLRALAAAVIGRMENLAVILAAACGLGIVETAIVWNEGSSTLVDPALFVIVIGALLLQRRDRESRVEDQASSSWQETADVRPVPRELAELPEVRWGRRLLLVLLAVAVTALPMLLGEGDTFKASAVIVYAIIGLSLVLLTGWAGEVSLGQVAFVGIGAAVAGSLNVHHQWDLTVSLLAAGAVGAVASIVIGLPALRIRGLFLGVSTMAFALATSSYLLNRDYITYLPDNVTERVERLPLLGRIDISGEASFYYVSAGVLAVVLWSISGLRKARVARVLIATRENSRAAQAFGVSVTRAKLVAFALSGFYASLGGGLFALHQRAVGQEVFAPAESIRALTMAVVGGLGSIPGVVLGAVFLQSTEWFGTSLPRDLRPLSTFVGSGLGLLVVLWMLPGGLGALLYKARDGALRALARRRGVLVPSMVADTAAAPPPRPASSAGDEQGPRLLQRFGWRQPQLDYFSFPDLATGEDPTKLLSVRSVDVCYGPVQVLFGVNLDLDAGEIVALLGTNGAGKSTLLRGVSGLVAPRNGSISFEGVDIAGMAAHRVAALGLVQMPGGRGVFPSLTVAENLRVASWLYRRDRRYVEEATEKALDLFPVLRQRLHSPAATLSGGQQQMLTLAMAFIAKPKLLMIDELSLGLAPAVVEHLLGAVRSLVDQGTTVILVEQSVNVALTVADTAYFMEKGEIRFRGPTAELLDRPDILRSVFLDGVAGTDWRSHLDPHPRPVAGPASPAAAAAATAGRGQPVVLETRGLTKRFSGITALDGVSMHLRAGEIVGVIGPNGAGKTTLFDLISGFLAPDHGAIVFDGHDVTGRSAEQRSGLGMARSFQDARLFSSLTVHQTVCVALDRRLAVKSPVSAALNLREVRDAERELGEQADEIIALMGLDAFRDKFVSELSTGSRRIVDLACQVGLRPRLILFDEPSSGIAQRETEALGPLLQGIRDQTGASLLVIEHDMPLITALSDRIIALDLGAVIEDGPADVVLNDPHVVASYLGTSRDVIERSGASAKARVATP